VRMRQKKVSQTSRRPIKFSLSKGRKRAVRKSLHGYEVCPEVRSMVELNQASGSSSNPSETRNSNPLSPGSAALTWLDGGAAVLDKAGKILSINDPLAVWFEASSGELAGQSLARLLAQHEPEWEPAVSRFLAQSTTFDRIELPSQRAAQRLAI